MTEDDRAWLHQVADALDKAERRVTKERNLEEMVTIALSDELARAVSDRLRAIATALLE